MFSFGIIAENFEVFENDIFYCKVLWVVGKCEWNAERTGLLPDQKHRCINFNYLRVFW